MARLVELSNHYYVAQTVLMILTELVIGSDEHQIQELMKVGLLDAMKEALNIDDRVAEASKTLYKLIENSQLSTDQFQDCLDSETVKQLSKMNGGYGPNACRAATIKANFKQMRQMVDDGLLKELIRVLSNFSIEEAWY